MTICGFPVGLLLIVVGYDGQLDDEFHNNIAFIAGGLMFAGCGLYLLVKMVTHC